MLALHNVTSHIQLLRRYAAALTGSIATGDAYLMACLETILHQPGYLDHSLPLRVGFFRAFARLWSSISDEHDHAMYSPGYKSAFTLLQMLDRTSRQAILLTTMCDFSYDEVAQILRREPATVRNLCLKAADFLQDYAGDAEPLEDVPAPDEEVALTEPFIPADDSYAEGSLASRFVQSYKN